MHEETARRLNLSPATSMPSIPNAALRIVQEHLASREGDAVSWIAVQSPDSGAYRAGLRHMPCTALMRIQNGTAWLLSTTDHPWDAERINRAGALLGGAR